MSYDTGRQAFDDRARLIDWLCTQSDKVSRALAVRIALRAGVFSWSFAQQSPDDRVWADLVLHVHRALILARITQAEERFIASSALYAAADALSNAADNAYADDRVYAIADAAMACADTGAAAAEWAANAAFSTADDAVLDAAVHADIAALKSGVKAQTLMQSRLWLDRPAPHDGGRFNALLASGWAQGPWRLVLAWRRAILANTDADAIAPALVFDHSDITEDSFWRPDTVRDPSKILTAFCTCAGWDWETAQIAPWPER